ncbi:splicing coactivator SRRM1 [Schizosaccharomyces japonicus yFS275]|uniref:Splicing coactivator SRRM1 n=1 Tax=Schizosaccharomyces japonicus (strain yFS275 / FY16936) TaxID=402676 RepID=B6K1D6_SCHJY|nr:splicing coactivator SRRM1 [Schizosaccharomyces japonicus yFS275]EEB07757.1 splicing coactivator SRRM1 [Schizosaccharomyces japonicus yFS275]
MSGFYKADMKRVNLEVLKPWIAKRIVELIGFEDEVVIDFVYSMLEEAAEEAAKSDDPSQTHTLDPRKLQLNLTGFLESNAPKFVEELWELILSASKNEYGIPQKMIEEKKAELERSRQGKNSVLCHEQMNGNETTLIDTMKDKVRIVIEKEQVHDVQNARMDSTLIVPTVIEDGRVLLMTLSGDILVDLGILQLKGMMNLGVKDEVDVMMITTKRETLIMIGTVGGTLRTAETGVKLDAIVVVRMTADCRRQLDVPPLMIGIKAGKQTMNEHEIV